MTQVGHWPDRGIGPRGSATAGEVDSKRCCSWCRMAPGPDGCPQRVVAERIRQSTGRIRRSGILSPLVFLWGKLASPPAGPEKTGARESRCGFGRLGLFLRPRPKGERQGASSGPGTPWSGIRPRSLEPAEPREVPPARGRRGQAPFTLPSGRPIGHPAQGRSQLANQT